MDELKCLLCCNVYNSSAGHDCVNPWWIQDVLDRNASFQEPLKELDSREIESVLGERFQTNETTMIRTTLANSNPDFFNPSYSSIRDACENKLINSSRYSARERENISFITVYSENDHLIESVVSDSNNQALTNELDAYNYDKEMELFISNNEMASNIDRGTSMVRQLNENSEMVMRRSNSSIQDAYENNQFTNSSRYLASEREINLLISEIDHLRESVISDSNNQAQRNERNAYNSAKEMELVIPNNEMAPNIYTETSMVRQLNKNNNFGSMKVIQANYSFQPHSLQRKRHFKNDITIHKGSKQFKCHICEKSFGSEFNLQRHTLTHTGEKPFICEICGRTFRNKTYLQNHAFAHTGEKPFNCDICGKTFRYSSNLQRHAFSHTGQKPFSCEICEKSFGRRECLQAHILIHTGEKPHECAMCGKKFLTKTNLNLHETIHTSV